MAWSNEQLSAITTYDKNLLVAAAAGSGKTSVLVERIIQRLLGAARDFHIDEVLVVTFTNAAAAEMRERIGEAIGKALRESPGNSHLERQLILLNAASISTIHAFCQSVVRQNFHLLDLDPKFRLANEQEANLLKRDVLEALCEAKYDGGDAAFLSFVDHYGNERGDEALYDIVLKLHDFSLSQPHPKAWLTGLKARFEPPEGQAIDATVWAEIIKRRIALDLAEFRQIADELIETAGRVGFDFYVTAFESDRALLDELIEARGVGWEALRRAVHAAKFATLRAPKETDEEQKAFFAKRRGRIKDGIKGLKETYFAAESAALMTDLRGVRPMVEAICALTAEFGDAFAAAKKARAIVDFSDLEHFCLRVLQDEASTPDAMLPSDAAKALQCKYKEVMVDEYQDVNGVQEAILSLVKKQDQPNLFLVGDVKQSVYRFRLAEPELFLDKYRNYPRGGASFARIDLARNFRSRAGVLAAINFIFAQVMSPNVAELSYGEAERLNPGPAYPASSRATVAGPVELHLIDRDDADAAETPEESEGEDLKGFALEAAHIAERVRALMREEPVVFDKAQKKYRPLAWRDIAILLRSVKHKANVLLETLHSADIPAYASVDSGYFQEIEVRVMLSLLSVIDNPRQDIPLAAVLHSPICGFSAEDLARVRVLRPRGNLLGALKDAAKAGDLPDRVRREAERFLLRLASWRSLARRRSVPELVWQLYRDTGYYDYVGGMPGGMLRQANLRMLYDRARQYETTNFRGLFRFLRFIEKMRDTGTDLSVARTLGESENVVRIMSIHKSKGLEFPVVIVADLGKNFNLQDASATLLMHKKLGLGPYVTDDRLNLRYPTVARLAIAVEMNRENKAEELRVLYVALTRAREKLILVGSAKRLRAKAAQWSRYAASQAALLPDHAIAGAKSYLDWLCPAVARHADGKVLREYGGCTESRAAALDDDASRWQVFIAPAGKIAQREVEEKSDGDLLDRVRLRQPLPESAEKAWVERVLGWQYPDESLQGVPAKLSVTEMKRRFELSGEAGEALIRPPLIASRPRFLQAKTKLTGAEYGTLMHSVMQHVDFRADVTLDGLQAQLDAFVRREIILPEHAERIDLRGVYDYLHSPIGKRMRSSSNVRREMPFSVMLRAKRFYPDVEDLAARIFVQGIIDVLFDEDDGMVLVDYKTDRGANAAKMAEKYQLQLSIYAEAIEKILGKRVKEKYLYVFELGKLVEIFS